MFAAVIFVRLHFSVLLVELSVIKIEQAEIIRPQRGTKCRLLVLLQRELSYSRTGRVSRFTVVVAKLSVTSTNAACVL
jgi:hypothetical protein